MHMYKSAPPCRDRSSAHVYDALPFLIKTGIYFAAVHVLMEGSVRRLYISSAVVHALMEG